MLYEPPWGDRYLWDTWLLPVEEGFHLFHMQKVAGEADSIEIGHAFSPDLVKWTGLEPALAVREEGAWDSVRLRTGDVLKRGDRYFLFYGSAPDHVDRVGVAASTDLLHWERHGSNPIAVPDGRWYEHDHATCAIPNVPWRDPCVRRDPQGDGWIMYLTARHREGPAGGRGTIATLRSPGSGPDELVRWEVGPPLDVMPGYSVMEVPDVFELDGKWYLLHSTTHGMGTRYPTCDPRLTAGTFVLWADRPEGPYTRPPRDILVASPGGRTTAYVARTAQTKWGRIAYYHNVYPQPPGSRARRGSFALPKRLRADAEGLQLVYLPLLERYAGDALPLREAPPVGGRARDGEWEVHGGGLTGRVSYGGEALALDVEAEDVMVTATVTVEAGQAAGVGVRVREDGRGLGVILNARLGTVSVVELDRGGGGVVWRALAERRADVREGVPVAVRVVAVRNVVDVFLDEALLLSVVAEGYGSGNVVFLADDAKVHAATMCVHRLDLPAVADGWRRA